MRQRTMAAHEFQQAKARRSKGDIAMTNDEKAVRQVVEDWMDASRRGDTAAVLALMTDDAVFMVPGQAPFGRQAFAAACEGMRGVRIEGRSEVAELQVLGEWAFMRNRIDMTATPAGGEPVHRSGYTLTLLRKEADGRWRLARDANLLTATPPGRTGG
jgi:uncharacterized protein (TIGR02246 family)